MSEEQNNKPLHPTAAKALEATFKVKKVKRLSPKQKLYAAKLLDPNLNQREAYMEVYGAKKTVSATDIQASTVAGNPRVQQHIDAIIERIAPNIGDNAVSYLNSVLMDPDKPDMVKMKALEMLTKWKGWATTKVEKKTLNANVDLSAYKLPTGDDNGNPQS